MYTKLLITQSTVFSSKCTQTVSWLGSPCIFTLPWQPWY